jgi:hypothetical protein
MIMTKMIMFRFEGANAPMVVLRSITIYRSQQSLTDVLHWKQFSGLARNWIVYIYGKRTDELSRHRAFGVQFFKQKESCM